MFNFVNICSRNNPWRTNLFQVSPLHALTDIIVYTDTKLTQFMPDIRINTLKEMNFYKVILQLFCIFLSFPTSQEVEHPCDSQTPVVEIPTS